MLDQEGHIKIADFGMCKEGIREGAQTKVGILSSEYFKISINKGDCPCVCGEDLVYPENTTLEFGFCYTSNFVTDTIHLDLCPPKGEAARRLL